MWLQLRSLSADLQWISPKLPSHWLSATTVGMTSSNFSSEKDLTTDETNSGDAPELNSEAPETCTDYGEEKGAFFVKNCLQKKKKLLKSGGMRSLIFFPLVY